MKRADKTKLSFRRNAARETEITFIYLTEELYGSEFFLVMSVVLHFAWTSQMVHKALVCKCIDVSLWSLVWNREDELIRVFDFRLVIETTFEIEITAPGCVYVMDHAACLCLSCVANRRLPLYATARSLLIGS